MSDEQIKPALTAEEAARRAIFAEWDSSHSVPFLEIRDDHLYYDNSGGEYGCEPIPAQKAAALCLYGQPFGFTQEDVQNLLALASGGEPFATPEKSPDEIIRSIASRIAALLPEEE